MTEQHKHCHMCGKPIPLEETFCSPKCAQIAMENQIKVQKSRRILYILIILIIVAWLYFFVLRGRYGI